MTYNLQYVDVLKYQTLTEEHLQYHKKYHNPGSYPELYGPNNISGGTVEEITLVPMSDIKFVGGKFQTHKTRYANGNPMHKEIKNSFYQKGLNLRKPGLMLQRRSDGLYPLTGHTRKSIFDDIGMTNCIAAIYTIPNDSDASKFAIKLNPKEDPAGPMSIFDIEQECKIAIEKGWIKTEDSDGNELPLDELISNIKERFVDIADGGFTNRTVDASVLRIANDMDNSFSDVLSWETQTQIKTWMSKNKYINSPEVMYLVCSASQVSKNIIKAAQLAVNNPGKKIRVVCHTGVLDSGNLKNSYDNLVETFRRNWESDIENIRVAFFKCFPDLNGTAKVAFNDNIKLYGSLPALTKYHNENKIVLYKKDSSVNIS